MAKGVSIHIGVNFVDQEHYGTRADLPYCEEDAAEMKKLAERHGFQARPALMSSMATSRAVLNEIAIAAETLEPGDILMLTYSGHGSYFPDLNGDESDKLDETWLLYDRMLIDDELYFAWSKFKRGVRILVISDSCHSGTVTKPFLSAYAPNEQQPSSLVEAMKMQSMLIYNNHRDLYDAHLKLLPPPQLLKIGASILLLSACNDSELAGAISRNGRKLSLFTSELLNVSRRLDHSFTYKKLIREIRERVSKGAKQTPGLHSCGRRNKQFEQEVPFTISSC